MTWQPVGQHTFVPTDRAVEVGSFDLTPGQDTVWVRITQINEPEYWPWSYGILSWRSASGLELGSIKAYSTQLGEVFRLGVGLPPSDGTGSLWFEPRGYNLGWIKAGFPWTLLFQAQAGSDQVNFNPYWGRVNSTLSPAESGDGVAIGGGSITLNPDGTAAFGSQVSFSSPSSIAVLVSRDAPNAECLRVREYGGNPGAVRIYNDGSATFIGNITAGNVSDVRFKKNITDASPQLADVVALGSQLKNWSWTDDAPLGDALKARRFLGLVAQEAEKVSPGLIYEVRSGDDDRYKAINHDILVMKLLGAVAELTARVEALEAA